MALPSTTPFALTGDNIIDAATMGYRWFLGADRTLKWSISDGFNGEYWNNPAGVQSTAAQIFATFSQFADIKFKGVGYYIDPIAAYYYGSDINISMSQVGSFTGIFSSVYTWARGFFPTTSSENLYAGQAGDVYLNISSAANTLPSYAPGSTGWALFMHEFGHTLGLKHPHDDGGTGRPTLGQIGWSFADQDWFSVMSYNDGYDWNQLSWNPATPMPLDVLGLQYLYGKNMATNAGDSVHQLLDNNFYTTVWDASGVDRVDVSASSQGWQIYLPSLQLSSLVDTKLGGAVPISQANLDIPLTLWWLMGDIENVKGSAYADDIVGNQLANAIDGGGGSDTMEGAGGSDSYYVNVSTDVIIETDANAVTGGTDAVYSSASSYTLPSNVEHGRIMATGTASMTGNGLANTLATGAGNNVLNGGAGVDTVTYFFATFSVTVTLGTTSSQYTGGSGYDTLIAIENLTGSAYADRLTGNASANALNGGAGVDTLQGGGGSDIYYVDVSTDQVIETDAVASTGGTDIVYSSASSYTLTANVENGSILATGTASMTGNSLANTLTSGAGSNTLNGGTGIDTASYSSAKSAVSVSLATTSSQYTVGSGYDTLISIENLTGSAYADRLTGNASANTLNGGAGADTLQGAGGSDIYYVDVSTDQVVEADAAATTGGTDWVYSTASSYTLAANVENGRILATGTSSMTGNGLANTLIAGAGNNTLNGAAGVDAASYTMSAADVTVNLGVTTSQYTGASGYDTLVSIEDLVGSNYNDVLTGSSGNNRLTGGSGNDSLVGGLGNDTLVGGAGNDTLNGGTGLDIFRFDTATSTTANRDVIQGFVAADDTVQLENLVFTSLTTTGTLSSANFRASLTGAAADSNDFILYDTDSGILYYDADGSGAAAAVQFALLSAMPAVTAADFVIT